MTKLKERFFTALFAINAVFSVLAVLMICLFLFANGDFHRRATWGFKRDLSLLFLP